MNITSKSRYALKIMMDLAFHADRPHVHRYDIARRQGIPSDYMDQILVRLRRGDLIESVRGRGGGYRLAKLPSQITVSELFAAVEDHYQPVLCQGEACNFEAGCSSKPAWDLIADTMHDALSKITVASLMTNVAPHHMCPVGGLKECKPASAQKSGSRSKEMESLL
jgi:Rrf2 family protein